MKAFGFVEELLQILRCSVTRPTDRTVWTLRALLLFGGLVD